MTNTFIVDKIYNKCQTFSGTHFPSSGQNVLYISNIYFMVVQLFKLSTKDILIIYVYSLNRNQHAKLYPPSTFQSSDIKLLSSKHES